MSNYHIGCGCLLRCVSPAPTAQQQLTRSFGLHSKCCLSNLGSSEQHSPGQRGLAVSGGGLLLAHYDHSCCASGRKQLRNHTPISCKHRTGNELPLSWESRNRRRVKLLPSRLLRRCCGARSGCCCVQRGGLPGSPGHQLLRVHAQQG